jgi:hypothetical protein
MLSGTVSTILLNSSGKFFDSAISDFQGLLISRKIILSQDGAEPHGSSFNLLRKQITRFI